MQIVPVSGPTRKQNSVQRREITTYYPEHQLQHPQGQTRDGHSTQRDCGILPP